MTRHARCYRVHSVRRNRPISVTPALFAGRHAASSALIDQARFHFASTSGTRLASSSADAARPAVDRYSRWAGQGWSAPLPRGGHGVGTRWKPAACRPFDRRSTFPIERARRGNPGREHEASLAMLAQTAAFPGEADCRHQRRRCHQQHISYAQ